MHALRSLKLNSITHKFLIKGHTQNEADSVHSLIEKSLQKLVKAGPIFTTEGFITAIKGAKKTGQPYRAVPLSHADFLDLKKLNMDFGPFKTAEVKLASVKALKLTQEYPSKIFLKHSFTETNYKEVVLIKNLKNLSKKASLEVYTEKKGLNRKPKRDWSVRLT